MLRIIQNSHAAGAKSYYSSGDYYLDGQELAGVWRGEGAKKLGLSGEVKRAEWDALCDGINPNTGEKLLQRRKENRTVCYDFNFHVPKSVSVLYAGMTEDDPRARALLDAFRESVESTMQDIEKEMHTRVRKDGKNEDRLSPNMTYGLFVHKTARPVAGVPDPHLHAHAVVFNQNFDAQEKIWKAGQFKPVVSDAAWFSSVFHARLSAKLAALGLPIERTKTGWEIEGVSRTLVNKFSRRTALIEEKAREKGIEDPDAKAELGAKTRSRKAKNLTMPELQAEWRGRMSPQELDVLARLEERIGGDPLPQDEGAAAKSMDYAIGHEFERRSVVPQRQLLATALRHGVGRVTPEQIIRQADRSGLIVGERKGKRMTTTRQALALESAIVRFARDGRGKYRRLGKPGRKLSREWLNPQQRAAVEHILSSHDGVMIVAGGAGVGKTTLLKEAVEAIEENGTEVFAFAPTAQASRGVLVEAGFKNADTVAALLKDKRMQERMRGQVLWIDEATLMGTRTAAELFGLAERLDCRVLLTGDRKQHGSVEAGAVLQLLEDEAGIKPAEVKEIKRQEGEYKEAIKALSEGKAAEGFARLDKMHAIREIADDEERYRQLASDYVDAVSAGKTTLVVSPTHAEGDRITAAIRSAMKDRNLLGKERHIFRVLENANLTEAQRGDLLNYMDGEMMLQFHQNGKGFKRGERILVEGQPLPLDQANRFTAYRVGTLELAAGDLIRITQNGYTSGKQKHRLNNGAVYRIKKFDKQNNIILDNGWKIDRNWGQIASGFVATSHSSQGRDVDRVFVGQSSRSFPASSRQQFYVSCSRGRKSVSVYCDDKEALKEAVGYADERITASELIAAKLRAVVDLHRRQEEPAFELELDRERERELEYERQRAAAIHRSTRE